MATSALATWSALGLPGLGSSRAWAGPALGEATPFSETWLRERARTLGAQTYQPQNEVLPAVVAQLSYDQHRDIRYRPDKALWRDEGLPFRAQFFHLGSYFQSPVHIYEVSGGMAREILYTPDLFDFGANSFTEPLSERLGYAGFRIHTRLNTPDYFDELVVFLGASYFRAVGRHLLYGLSARGLAIDTASAHGEEFPVFREFWLERPALDANQVVVYALLDSPSCAGAYKFVVKPGDTTVMEVTASLFPRKAIEKLGLAPLTSMFLFGPNDRLGFDDFRPEVHDSDGLAMWTGAGEWIWRPLVNPSRLRLSRFADDNPRGFGLLQRERDFNNYQDLEAHYELRPSVWIEPIGPWGRGAVELVEIPTHQEIHDNIVVAWVPERPVEAGSDWPVAYRVYWGAEPPQHSPGALVTATRVGAGGVSGSDRDPRIRKFVIDFTDGPLTDLPADAKVEPVITVSRGQIVNPVAQLNSVTGGQRVFFDFRPESDDVAELRCYLKLKNTALSETWSYQWTP